MNANFQVHCLFFFQNELIYEQRVNRFATMENQNQLEMRRPEQQPDYLPMQVSFSSILCFYLFLVYYTFCFLVCIKLIKLINNNNSFIQDGTGRNKPIFGEKENWRNIKRAKQPPFRIYYPELTVEVKSTKVGHRIFCNYVLCTKIEWN